MEHKLTLEKAMNTIRLSAAVKEEQGQLKQLKEGSKGNQYQRGQDWSASDGWKRNLSGHRYKSLRYNSPRWKVGLSQDKGDLNVNAKTTFPKKDTQQKELLVTNVTKRSTSALSVSPRLLQPVQRS